MKKSSVPWLFAVIILSFLFILSIILGLTGYYFSVAYLNSNSEIVLGETVSISVLPNQSNVVSFTIDGAFMPNETLPQIVQINAEDMERDLRVRVKAEVFGLNEEFDFVTTDHFEKASDGYYYFDDVLKGGNKITFCNYLVTPRESEFLSRQKYILSIVVETLETQFDSQNIWKNE